MAPLGYGRVSTEGQSLTAAPSGRSCCKYALHDGSPDSESPANLQDAHALGPQSAFPRVLARVRALGATASLRWRSCSTARIWSRTKRSRARWRRSSESVFCGNGVQQKAAKRRTRKPCK
jgi:hypothetical protein